MKTLSWKASLILLFGLACFVGGQTTVQTKDTTSQVGTIAFQSESSPVLRISREGKLTITEGLTMDEAARKFITILEKQFGRQLVDLQTPCSPKKP